MNQYSNFQLEHPLSPRKFWKKISDRLLVNIIYSVFLEFIIFAVFYGVMQNFLTEKFATVFVSFLPWLVVGAYVSIYFLLTIVYAIYVKVYIKRYYYDCGDKFIIIKKGVFAPTEIHVQYQKIQDVYVDQDILDRLFGIYDVHISSATITSGIEAHIDGVSFEVAEKIKNIILAKIHNVDGGTSNISQIPVSQPQQVLSNPVQLSHKISSETYPVSGRWVWSAIISAIIQSVITTLFLGFFIIMIGDAIQPGVISNLSSVAPLVLIVFGIVFLYKIIWFSIWKSNYYFEFLPEFILVKTGVISRQENHLPYKSIQNVSNTQGVIDRILGLSTVVVENAAVQLIPTSRGQSVAVASGISLVWQTPAKAQELNEVVNSIVSKINPQSSSSMGI